MNLVDAPDWIEANQGRLCRAVKDLLRRLETLTLGGDDEAGPVELDVPALDRLGRCFELSPFERGALLLAAAVEFDGGFSAACAVANGDTHRPWPTFGLALAVLPDGHWSALSPDGPLRRYRLVSVDRSDNLTSARLRIDERVMHLLVGVDVDDPRLAPFVVQRRAAGSPLPASQRGVVDRIARQWAEGGINVAQVCGPDRYQRRAVVDGVALATGAGRVLEVDASALPGAGDELDDVMARLARECVLGGALVSWSDPSPTVEARRWRLDQLLSHAGVRVVVEDVTRTAIDLGIPVDDVPTPSIAEQRDMWRSLLATRHHDVADRLARSFVLTADVAASLVAGLPGDGVEELWERCRARLRTDVGGAVVVRRPEASWDRLVLPADSVALLRALEVEALHTAEVQERWGFGHGGRPRRGTSALFCGPSGTGKTLAAEVIASALGVDLLHVDLSQVVNKYIGETEKNLARVFDAGERSGAVLLFDECDALFGKRTEIKDSHDRYANIEVSFLLQRMEAYTGVAVLTTNMRENLDPAFVRRLRFIVTFPHPSRELRARIWEIALPPWADRATLDPGVLSGLDVAGGVIANVAMAAAMRAAADGGPMSMGHVRAAAELEYVKLERPLTGSELAGWS